MKKTFIAFSIGISIFSYSSMFNVIIKKNNYEVEDTFTKETRYSEWRQVSPEECTTDIDASDVYNGFQENQEEICVQEEERDVVVVKIYTDGSEKIISETSEYQEIETVTNKLITGTHLEDNCLNILNFNQSFLGLNQYYNSNIGIINCDMTTEGGGWTQVANITNQTEVIEGNVWIDNINSKDASFGVKYLNLFNPQNIMFENKSINSTYGQGDLIVVSRTNNNWGWSPSIHNNDSTQTAKIFDNSSSSWVNLGNATYASHQSKPWQDSPFSFTINGMQNDYSGQYSSRLTLGGTFTEASGNGTFYSFYGNLPSEDPINHGDWRTNGKAAIWMK